MGRPVPDLQANPAERVVARNFQGLVRVLRARIEHCPEIAVGWESLSNRVYQVQCSSDWAATAWTDLGAPVAGTGSTVWVVDSVGGQLHRFYRVVKLP